MTSTWEECVVAAQKRVERATEQLANARYLRAANVRAAHQSGATIYAIAKTLGLSQNAVRRILGL